MNAKELIAQTYEIHLHDHTATADFEVCTNPLCKIAYCAETELAALKAERDEYRKLLSRADFAFRCNLSQPEANDYYWRTREDIAAALKAKP